MACALRKRATGGKSLFIIGSQSPGTNPEKTHNNDDVGKNPLFFFRSAPPSPPFLVVVSTFTTLTRPLEKSAIEMCAKSTLKRGLLLVVIIMGVCFLGALPNSLSPQKGSIPNST